MERIPRQSVVEATTDSLRQAILGGEMRPGEPIRTRVVQELLGISHIPIREAIQRLEAEGLVVATPRLTPVVAGVGLDELAAIYELRRMIELPTIYRSRVQANAAAVEAVHEAFTAFERVADEPRAREYWERHDDFHWALLAAGANAWTQRTLDRLWRGSERYVRIFVLEHVGSKGTLRLHRVLLDAYDKGQPQELADALDDHFAETERVIREGFLADPAASNG
jgi:DNA-binding GntR family transcriptional regulator